MFAAMIFAISTVAISQFGMYYWRAVLASVASQPVSESVLAAASAENRPLRAADWPIRRPARANADLGPAGGSLSLVRFYYGVISAVDILVGARVPVVAAWSEREGAICARYGPSRLASVCKPTWS